MMGSTKLITSCVVVTFTLITVLMEHSASGSTPCECKKKEITMTYVKMVEDLIGKIKENILSGINECGDDNDDGKEHHMNPVDCAEVLRLGHTKSGIYTVWPKTEIIDGSVEVYCDMDTDGGGWTVIQRRGDYGGQRNDFYQGWQSYKKGFGDMKKEFWLGNDLIFAFTNQARYSIRFDLSDFQGNRAFALYDDFRIEDEDKQYKLHISGYSGNARDSVMEFSNNMMFSTKDRDNDKYSGGSCAQYHKGAWWYNYCGYSNLNGLYLKGKNSVEGVYWWYWQASYQELKTTEMKIRPK